MDSNSLDNLENNKNTEDVDSNAKKLAALLLPKMGSQQNNKFNYNEMERNFYKTSGKAFFNNNKTNKIKKFTSDKFLYNPNQKRFSSNDMNKKYYTSNHFLIKKILTKKKMKIVLSIYCNKKLMKLKMNLNIMKILLHIIRKLCKNDWKKKTKKLKN